jgi:hypothetical protein
MGNRPAALGLPGLLLGAGALLLLPFLHGGQQFWLACGSFVLALGLFALLLLLAWLRPSLALTRPLRSWGASLLMLLTLVGLAVWGVSALF